MTMTGIENIFSNFGRGGFVEAVVVRSGSVRFVYRPWRIDLRAGEGSQLARLAANVDFETALEAERVVAGYCAGPGEGVTVARWNDVELGWDTEETEERVPRHRGEDWHADG